MDAVSYFLFECVSLLFAAALLPVAYLPINRLRSIPVPQRHRPIILVHGYLHNRSGWAYILRFLEKEGFGPVYTLNMGNHVHSIVTHAEHLGQFVQKIEAKYPGLPPILIGHSMGGAIATYYNEYVASKEHVTDVITLGSPLHGSHAASFAFGNCADEMRYGSAFICNLAQRIIENRHGARYHHIAAAMDQLVVPADSALTGAGHSREKVVYHHGHVGLLFSREVCLILCEWLDELCPTANDKIAGNQA
jgi:pimeloyl-ACP methyl ester carboxylesterase